VPTFQSMHTVVLVEPLTERTTAVSLCSLAIAPASLRQRAEALPLGNGWTLEQLKKRFDVGPVDWAKLAAEAQKAAKK